MYILHPKNFWRLKTCFYFYDFRRIRLKKQYFRRDKTMIGLLTGVVLVLIICHTPKTIINVYESYQVLIHSVVCIRKHFWDLDFLVANSHSSNSSSWSVSLLVGWSVCWSPVVTVHLVH